MSCFCDYEHGACKLLGGLSEAIESIYEEGPAPADLLVSNTMYGAPLE